MIADMAGVPLYVVHTSCEEAHEAIRRARQQGKRVWGEPLIQHLTLDESEYFHDDWDHAARRVMSPPFRNKKHQDSLWAGLQVGLAVGGGHGSLRLHDRAETLWRGRFHQDPQWHRRA
jgi:dihydropyrimidinase